MEPSAKNEAWDFTGKFSISTTTSFLRKCIRKLHKMALNFSYVLCNRASTYLYGRQSAVICFSVKRGEIFTDMIPDGIKQIDPPVISYPGDDHRGKNSALFYQFIENSNFNETLRIISSRQVVLKFSKCIDISVFGLDL